MQRFARGAALVGLAALWVVPLQAWAGPAAHADAPTPIASVSPTYASPEFAGSRQLTITTAQPFDAPTVRLVAPAGSGQPDLVGDDTTVDNSGTVVTTDIQPAATNGGIGAAPGDYTLEVCDDPQCVTPLETGSFRFVVPAPAIYDISLGTVRPATTVPFALSGDFFTAGSQVSFSGPVGDLAFTGAVQPPVGPAVPAKLIAGSLAVSSSAAGQYDVVVTDLLGRSVTLPDAVTVSADAPTPPVTMVTPSVVPPDSAVSPIRANSSLVISGASVQPGAVLSAASVTESTPDGVQPATGADGSRDDTVNVAADSTTGPRDVTITNPDTSQVVCAGCLDVEPRPSAPASLSSVNPVGDGVTLTWSPPADTGGLPVLGYQVGLIPSNGNEYDDHFASVTGTTAHLTGLTAGALYDVDIAAYTAAGRSPQPLVAPHAVSWPMVPTAPTDLLASAGPDSVRLTWSPPMSDGGATVDHYSVGFTDGSSWLQQVTGTTATITGLTPGTDYHFAVVAHNSQGDSVSASTGPVDPTGFQPRLILTVGGSNRVAWGAPLTLIVHATSAGPTPTGPVSVTIDGRPVCPDSTLSVGTASCPVGGQPIAAGRHTVAANYAGDTDNQAANTSQTFTVTRSATAVTLHRVTRTVRRGHPITLTGRLRLGGASFGHRVVGVYAEVLGSGRHRWRWVGSVVTSSHGQLRVRFHPRRSTRYQFRRAATANTLASRSPRRTVRVD